MRDARSATFQDFAQKWLWSDSVAPVTAQELDKAERALGLCLPAAYRDFVEAFGTPSTTIALLDAIVKGEIDAPDLQEFIRIEELAKATSLYESGGMESGFLGFATDCGGNMFLFSRADCVAGRDDAPVWFFDHDFVEMREEAASFTQWVERFAAMEGVK